MMIRVERILTVCYLHLNVMNNGIDIRHKWLNFVELKKTINLDFADHLSTQSTFLNTKILIQLSIAIINQFYTIKTIFVSNVFVD